MGCVFTLLRVRRSWRRNGRQTRRGEVTRRLLYGQNTVYVVIKGITHDPYERFGSLR